MKKIKRTYLLMAIGLKIALLILPGNSLSDDGILEITAQYRHAAPAGIDDEVWQQIPFIQIPIEGRGESVNIKGTVNTKVVYTDLEIFFLLNGMTQPEVLLNNHGSLMVKSGFICKAMKTGLQFFLKSPVSISLQVVAVPWFATALQTQSDHNGNWLPAVQKKKVICGIGKLHARTLMDTQMTLG